MFLETLIARLALIARLVSKEHCSGRPNLTNLANMAKLTNTGQNAYLQTCPFLAITNRGY